MNSKERVRAALRREPVDKVPLGFYLVDHDTISRVIGRPTPVRNRVETQVALWEGRRDELVQTYTADIIEFYEKIDCADLLCFKSAPIMPPRGWREPDPPKRIGPNLWRDSQGAVWQSAPESNSLRIVETPRSSPDSPGYTVAMFADHSPPPVPDASCFEIMDALIARFGDERYIACDSGGIVALSLLGGFEDGLVRLATEPEVVKAHNAQQVAHQNFLDRYHIRPGADGVLIEQDMAGTSGPFISPAMFRELCFPYMKARIANIKSYVSEVLFHNCGNNLPLMDMFLDAGIDAYESIQANTEMTIATLRERYGERLTIWGAVSVDALTLGTTDDVRRDVRLCMEEGRQAPGFILGPSHSIAFGTKYENFRAMLDEFDRLRDVSPHIS